MFGGKALSYSVEDIDDVLLHSGCLVTDDNVVASVDYVSSCIGDIFVNVSQMLFTEIYVIRDYVFYSTETYSSSNPLSLPIDLLSKGFEIDFDLITTDKATRLLFNINNNFLLFGSLSTNGVLD